jgi:phosphoribosylformylglycinamidine synthase
VRSIRGYLLAAELAEHQVQELARDLLADPIADELELLPPGAHASPRQRRVTIVPRPGVTDPVAGSLRKALRDAGLPEVATGTYRAFEFATTAPREELARAAFAALANEVVHAVLVDEIPGQLPGDGDAADLAVHEVPLRHLGPAELTALSRDGGLALDEREMLAIRAHYVGLGREPTRLELETIAQTWSEHCKHKTLTAKVRYEGRVFDNLLRSTIARVTEELDRDFCVSVFVDNAGVIAFDDEDCVCIKVETHNHPSALEPFGGAGTGVGGVIRDVLGTGRGARPIASTDVFCLAPIDTPQSDVPAGCLHPLQILRGVVAGVRDYGNPMGIPTVNGAIHFDPDFVGNPLVYVGNIGILPRDRVVKKPQPGDVVLVVGGRTGRDGLHGATFSSLELHTASEITSGGAVQIGNPIVERKVMDAVLRIRDEDLCHAITDCGAGGFSSAVGEMAEHVGADVDLRKAPLKYQGLAPWEIWISEAQERMVMAVPEDSLARALEICGEEDVEATVIGSFTGDGRLRVRHGDALHGDLDLGFLHRGLPTVEREATWAAPRLTDPELPPPAALCATLLEVLADPNVASKEWVVRQYDHEVQAATMGKPLVGARDDGPADAAVLAPKLGSRRGLVLASGLNPRYGKIDPAAMAECALDEALRNIVAAGGDPERTAVLDNYCWGSVATPERLGGLVRATLALCDLAVAYRTPFVSGKDSLNNEFRAADRIIQIPGCILVTALSVIPDVERTVSSDLKRAGNALWIVGTTRRELGGSVYWRVRGALGATVPRVDAAAGKAVLDAVARAIQAKTVVAAHDLSEGGLGAALAEMCIGGRLGARIALDEVPGIAAWGRDRRADEILFSESQSRFLLEVPRYREVDLQENLRGVPHARLGTVAEDGVLACTLAGSEVLAMPIDVLVRAFKGTLDLDGTLVRGRS